VPNYHPTRIGIEVRAAHAQLHRNRASSSRFQVDRLLNQLQQLQDALANNVKVSLASLTLLLRDRYHKDNHSARQRAFLGRIAKSKGQESALLASPRPWARPPLSQNCRQCCGDRQRKSVAQMPTAATSTAAPW